ncbi:contractile injection system protein, VgrG/Pvc8 family [Sulfurimonas sp.]|uniref:phage late control D family protein n=1 Tax=Sulfurimonas sp. TaxID=2022749 RepID=UPI0025E5125A|nr:contractile injection system protein, VgrG/Pvc8 family [Sulfurimonas sp.]
MTPIFKLLANGKDVTKSINLNSSKIEFNDEAGVVSDDISLTIEGTFKKPKYEDELKLWIGTKEKGLFYCGLFMVQSSKNNNDTSIDITATAADFSKSLKRKRNLSYESVSIKQIVQKVATRHKLEVVSDFEDINIDHIEQTSESDLHFLKRIAKDYNALFAVKNNKIVFKKKMKNAKKSENLPRYTLIKDEFSGVSIENTNKTLYSSCKAVWRDTKDNKQHSITVGSGEPVKIIKDSFENVADAKIKAEATLQKANAGTKSGSINSYGFELYAGGILDLQGTAQDDGEYDIISSHHTLDSSGWNMSVEIEN